MNNFSPFFVGLFRQQIKQGEFVKHGDLCIVSLVVSFLDGDLRRSLRLDLVIYIDGTLGKLLLRLEGETLHGLL